MLGIKTYNILENIGNFERTEQFSIEIWFLATADRTNSTIISHVIGNRGWGILSHGSRGKIANIDIFLANNFTTNFLSVTTVGPLNLPNNTWNHLIVTYNGNSLVSGLKCYINNSLKSVLIAKDTLTDTIKSDAHLQIGHSAVYPYFSGKLDEVVIYTRILSATEVSQRYNAGAGTEILFGSAYLQYHLNEVSGSAVSDSSGNLRNAVTISSPSWVTGKINKCIQLNGSTQYIQA